MVTKLALDEGQNAEEPNFVFEWGGNQDINDDTTIEELIQDDEQELLYEANNEAPDTSSVYSADEQAYVNDDESSIISENKSVDNEAHDSKNENEEIDAESIASSETDQPPSSHSHNLRGNRIDYSHRYAFSMAQIGTNIKPTKPYSRAASDLKNHALMPNILLTQYGVRAGIKKYGEIAIEAIMSECKQLDQMDALHPVHKQDIPRGDLLKAC